MSERDPKIESFYQSSINDGLSDSYRKCNYRLNLDPKNQRVVIFSDHHRGIRDGADDFKQCERAYNSAIGYYLESDYTLIILGDAEELWECRPGPVMRAYRDTLGLEAEFIKRNRYYRIYGNHDDYWEKKGTFEAHLRKEGILKDTESIPVLRSLILYYNSDPSKKIFLVHGHQGTFDSDILSPLSRFFVRYIWRNIQRIFRIKLTTPAKDVDLKSIHDLAMYNWVSGMCDGNEKMILIAGHTHLPVFASINHIGRLEKELDELKRKLKAQEVEGNLNMVNKLTEEISLKRAQLEYIKAKSESRKFMMEKPCYFNTGCCSYSDGDVTGIEISSEEIRLVRWPDDQGIPRPKVLEKERLEDIFRSI